MTNKKIALLGILILAVTGMASAESVEVSGLTEENVNSSLEENGVRFSTSYLNKTVSYKNVFVPEYLQDDLNNFKAQFQSQGNQEKLKIQIQFQGEQKDSDDDMPGFLSQYQYQAQQQVNPGQIQFQVQSSLDTVDLGNGTSMEEDADYDVQIQNNGEKVQIDGSLNRKIGGNQILNDASMNFSTTGGEFSFDTGVIKPQVSAHYEHLIVNHKVRSSVSPEYGETVEKTENVYSGNDTEKIPFANSDSQSIIYPNQDVRRQSLTYDNLYEKDAHRIDVVVGIRKEDSIKRMDLGGDRFESNKSYTDVEESVKEANLSNDILIEDASNYKFISYETTVGADSVKEVEAYVNSNYEGESRVYMWILGSAGGSTSLYQSSDFDVRNKVNNVGWRVVENMTSIEANSILKIPYNKSFDGWKTDSVPYRIRNATSTTRSYKKFNSESDGASKGTGDVDGDGDKEPIRNVGSLEYYESDTKSWKSIPGSIPASIAGQGGGIGDFHDTDNDGRQELYLTLDNTSTNWNNITYYDFEDQSVTWTDVNPTEYESMGSIADVDNDGHKEQVFTIDSDYSSKADYDVISLYDLENGSVQTLGTGTRNYGLGPAVDVNGDGYYRIYHITVLGDHPLAYYELGGVGHKHYNENGPYPISSSLSGDGEWVNGDYIFYYGDDASDTNSDSLYEWNISSYDSKGQSSETRYGYLYDSPVGPIEDYNEDGARDVFLSENDFETTLISWGVDYPSEIDILGQAFGGEEKRLAEGDVEDNYAEFKTPYDLEEGNEFHLGFGGASSVPSTGETFDVEINETPAPMKIDFRAGSFNGKNTVGTQGEWAEGSTTGVSINSNGYITSSSKAIATFLNKDHEISIYEHHTGEIIDTNVDATALGDINDYDGDGNTEILYTDGSQSSYTSTQNLMYYEYQTGNTEDVGVDARSIGYEGDADGDGEKDFAYKNSNGEIAWYDPIDQSTHSTGFTTDEVVGGIGDIDTDGSPEISLQYNQGVQAYYDLADNSINDISGIMGTPYGPGTGDIVDYDNDGQKDDLLYYSDNEYALYYWDGSNQSRNFITSDNGGGSTVGSFTFNRYTVHGAGGWDDFKKVRTSDNEQTTLGTDVVNGYVNGGSHRLGGIHRYSQSQTGRYTSKLYENRRTYWTQATVNASITSDDSVNLTVKTSNDDFANTVSTQTIELSDGTKTYNLDGLQTASRDMKFEIEYESPNSDYRVNSVEIQGRSNIEDPSADFNSNNIWDYTGLFSGEEDTSNDAYSYAETGTNTLSLDGSSEGVLKFYTNMNPPNAQPSITSSKYIRDSNSDEYIELGIDDSGEKDVDSYTGFDSATEFTNSTLKSAISPPFSSDVTISDILGATSNTATFDLDQTDTGTQEHSYSHDEDTQRINRSISVSNYASEPINYSITTGLPGTVIQGQSFTGTISGSSTVTETSITEGDWISQTVSSLDQDMSSTADLGTQYLYKSKDLTETGGYGFTGVDISSPSMPGTCSNCAQRTLDIAAGETLIEYYNSSSDWISNENEVNDRKEVTTFDHDEDNLKYKNETELIVDNSRSLTFTGVDISSMCSTTTSADIPSGTGVKATDTCTTTEYSGDFISETVGSLQEDSGKQHNLTEQYVKKTKDFTEQESISWTNVDLLAPTMPGTCTDCGTRTRDVAADESFSQTYHSESDFITGETKGTQDKGQNTSKTSTLGTQYAYNQTFLEVSNSRSFGFSNVEISNKCSIDSAAEVPSGTNKISTACDNKTTEGDFLDETEGDFQIGSDSVTLGINYEAAKPLDIQETSGDYSWKNVSTTAQLNTPAGCSITNNTDVDVPAGATVSKSVGYQCNPGSVGLTDHDIIDNEPTADFEKHQWITDEMEVTSNATENTTVVWKITESDLPEWDDRVDVDGKVDGSYKGIEVEDGVGAVYFRINTSHTNSSIHTGTHTATLEWVTSTGSSDGGGGGGGGGGGTVGGDDSDEEENETEPVVEFYTDNNERPLKYEGATGTTDTFTLQLRNYLDSENQLGVKVPEGGGALCQYVTLQETVTASTYGKNATYSLPDRSTSLSSDFGARQVSFKVNVPSEQKFDELSSSNELSCQLDATSEKSISEDPVITVSAGRTLVERLNDLFGFRAFEESNVCSSPEALSASEGGCSEENLSKMTVPTAQGTAVLSVLLFLVGSIIYVGRNEGWRIRQ